MSARKPHAQSQGPATDEDNNPVVDPTKNVLDLVKAAIARQDDLRTKDREISDIQHKHQTQITKLRATQNAIIGKMREEYQEKIAHAESGRLDSIRQVDREEVAKTAGSANTAVAVLAKQTADLAATLDKKVSDTAAAAEARGSAQYSDTNKRLSALELSSSEGKGKSQVSDPATERLSMLVEKLVQTQAEGSGRAAGPTPEMAAMQATLNVLTAQMSNTSGRSSGINATWIAIGGVVLALGTLLAMAVVGVTLVIFLTRPTAAVQNPNYVPPAPGTMVPSPQASPK